MKKKEAEKELNKILEGAKFIGYVEGVSNMLMSSTNNLIEKYASLFGLIIGVEFDYWVGDMRKEDQKAERPSQPVDVAQYGDYFFNLYDIRVVLDNFEHWFNRFGTLSSLAQEIIDWHDYAVHRKDQGKTYINLFNWLNGCPRDIDEREGGADERATNEEGGE